MLEQATGTPLAELLRTYISNPLGLDDTVSNQGQAIPAPALHGFSTDRGTYEDTIDWNPSSAVLVLPAHRSRIGTVTIAQ